MLASTTIVLLISWIFCLVAGFTYGGLAHILLLAALALMAVSVLRGKHNS